MRNLLLLFAVLLGFTACVKEIPLGSDIEVAPRPVFHFFMRPDSVLRADLGRVVSISDNAIYNDQAVISVYRNNQLQGDLLAQGNGRYVLVGNDFKPRDSFRIEATDGNYNFYIRGRMPSAIAIQKIDTQTLLVPGIGPAFNMDIRFTDSAVDDNYYRIYALRFYYEYTLDASLKRTDSTLRVRRMNIDGSALPFIQNNFNNYTSSEILFTDATFNGTQPTFSVYTPENVHETPNERTVKVECVLENLEKPLYDFINTRNAHIWQQQSISQLPGVVLGNVAGGYGVAAAYTQSRIQILFK